MIYFIVGTQGCGHHLFANACPLKEAQSILNAICLSHDTNKEVEIINRHCDYIILASYPYIEPINSIKRPCLFLCDEVKPSKLIFVYRDPVDATISSYNRFKGCDKNIITHAKVVLDNLCYINSYIEKKGLDERRLIFDYNDICENPEKFTDKTGIPLERGLIKKASKKPDEYKLERWFKKRESLYHFLKKNITKL